jgi:hypothetical protein
MPGLTSGTPRDHDTIRPTAAILTEQVNNVTHYIIGTMLFPLAGQFYYGDLTNWSRNTNHRTAAHGKIQQASNEFESKHVAAFQAKLSIEEKKSA